MPKKRKKCGSGHMRCKSSGGVRIVCRVKKTVSGDSVKNSDEPVTADQKMFYILGQSSNEDSRLSVREADRENMFEMMFWQ